MATRHKTKYSPMPDAPTLDVPVQEEPLPAGGYDAEIVLSRASTSTTHPPRIPVEDSKAGRPGLDGAEVARSAVATASGRSRHGEKKSIRRGDSSPSRRDASEHNKPYLIPRLVAYYQGVAWTRKPPGNYVVEPKSAVTKQTLPNTAKQVAVARYEDAPDNVSKSAPSGINPQYDRSKKRLNILGRPPNNGHIANAAIQSAHAQHNRQQQQQREEEDEHQQQQGHKEQQQRTSPIWAVLSQQQLQRKQGSYQEEPQQDEEQYRQPSEHRPQPQKKAALKPLSQPGDPGGLRSRQIILPNARSNKYSIVYVRKSRVNPRLWAYFQSGNPSRHQQSLGNPSTTNGGVIAPPEVTAPPVVVTGTAQTVVESDRERDQAQVSGQITTHPGRKQVTAAEGQHDFRLDEASHQRWNSSADANMAPRLGEEDAPAATARPGAEPTKVVLVTYMRGGSSLLGQLFNQNPRAIYWFEPMDAVYSHMYGTGEGWLPLDIAFDHSRELR